MPIYSYHCPCGKVLERMRPFEERVIPEPCECGEVAEYRIAAPMTVNPRPSGVIRSEAQVESECGKHWRGTPTREGGDRKALYFDGAKK
jgi:hypothetical protein